MALEVRLQILCCLFMFLLNIYPGMSRTTMLFGADPAGGLWGVKLDTTNGTSARLLTRAGYPKSLFDKQIATVSHDPVSGQVLLETSNPRSLYYGPLCEVTSKPPRVLAKTITDFTLTENIVGDCAGCEASAFTLYDSKIYFLMNGEFVDTWGDYSRVLQIRVFQPCDQCQLSKKGDFTFQDMVTCSKIVINVMRELIEDDAQIKAGKHMKIVEINGILSFFFQSGNITMSDSGRGKASMALWHADVTGNVHMLYEREVDNSYGDWHINSQGAIDYHEGMLCWTYPDTVFCGDLIGHQLRRGAKQMEVGDGYIAGVCQGQNTENLHIVSGVAVADSGAARSFVFGCYPQEAGIGGTGIKAKKDQDPSAIKYGEVPMMAGSVFVVDELDDTCTFDPIPQICLGPDDPKPKDEEPEPESEEESEKEVEPEEEDKEEEKKDQDTSSVIEKEVVSEGEVEENTDKHSEKQNNTGESKNSATVLSRNIVYIIMSLLPVLPILC